MKQRLAILSVVAAAGIAAMLAVLHQRGDSTVHAVRVMLARSYDCGIAAGRGGAETRDCGQFRDNAERSR